MMDRADLSKGDLYKTALIVGPVVGIILGGIFFDDPASGITVGVVVAIFFVMIFPGLAETIVGEMRDSVE